MTWWLVIYTFGFFFFLSIIQIDFFLCLSSLSSRVPSINSRICSQMQNRLYNPISSFILIDNPFYHCLSRSSHSSTWKDGLFYHRGTNFGTLLPSTCKRIVQEFKELYEHYQESAANFCPNKGDLSEVCRGRVFNRIPYSRGSSQFSYPGSAQAGTVSHPAACEQFVLFIK